EATLRGGVGSPRERVELLADLLRQAGFETEILAGFVPAERREDLEGMLKRPPLLPAAPELSDADLQRWSTLLQTSLTAGNAPALADPDYADSMALAARLRPLVPDPAQPFAATIRTVRMPFLRFRAPGGEWTFANPNVLNAELGDSVSRGNPAAALDPLPLDDTVKIRVWMRSSRGNQRDEAIDLVERTWNVTEVVGRTATVQFSPLLDFADLIIQHPEDLDLFLPSIQLAGPYDSSETVGALSASGPLFTRGGFFSSATDDEIRVDGDIIATSGAATTTVAAQVRSFDITADASAFPMVEVRFDARAADGSRIPGMLAGDFSVSENGDRIVPLMRANRYRPRVVFAIDNSLSVPQPFRDGFNDLVLNLAEVLFDRYEARVMATAIGDFDDDNPFVDNLEALRMQLENDVLGSSSFIWTEVSQMAKTDADLIIALTDANNTGPRESLTPSIEQLIRSGPPVLILGAGEIFQESIDVLSELTDTRLVPVEDVDAARAAALEYIEDRRVSYRVRYRAPRQGPTVRQVDVALRSGSAAGQATYTITSTDTAEGGIVGLYLDIEHQGKTHRRTLAGIPRTADIDSATPADLSAVRGALLGRYALRFEAGFVTPAMLFDELITAYLANRDALLAHGNFDTLAEAIDRGLALPTTEAAFFLATAPPEGAVTTPTGIRAVMQSERLDYERGVRYRELDILPFGVWATDDA
ncbi:MAG: hypothetical protein AAFV29_08070, partial [Myxococcota bacterium]